MKRLIALCTCVGVPPLAVCVLACGSTSPLPDPTPVDAGGDAGVETDARGGLDGAASSCSVDADCRTFESSCEICRCLAVGATDPDPECLGAEVACVAPSCMDEVAVCRDDRCVLAAR